ncbi:hypothetical protein, conserved [Eimeria maxima]|uniref:Uncharacterized protein n=1 Tax=Eimeria maxima TaxID=5804 RepID=U6M6F8_EIMMA|nr:hypothetical protein, conserved [Eimeria maxima]CDJ59822.1 hypothetical protein, conserved [Eimeria maxima]
MAFEVLLEGKQSEGQETLDVLRSPSTESTTNHHEWAEAGPGATGGPDELCSNATCVRRWGKVQAERFRGGFYWVLLSMLVPALIISVLREVCRTSQSASIGKAPGTWIRRLSSSEGSTEEDDTLSQLIEVCAEMQEDLALSVPQRTNPDGPMDAAEQVARIAFDLELEALAFERAMRRTQQQGRASIPSQPRHPASADISCQRTRQAEPVHMPGPQLGTPSNLHLQSGITASDTQPAGLPSDPMAAPTGPLGEDSQPLPSVPPPLGDPTPFDWPPQVALPILQSDSAALQAFAGTQPPVVASNSVGLPHQVATLLAQDVAHINTRGQPLSQLPSVEHSGSDPDMWLEEGPATESALEAPKQSSHSSHWMSPDPAAHASWQVPEGESNTGAAGLRSPAESTGSARRDSARLQPEAVAEEAPATARALAAARASLQADLDAHPYVRLPGLARGVVVPNILLSRTSFVSTKGQPLRDALFPLRHLFSRLELSQTEVNFLVGHIEELAIASGGRAKQATLMGRPGHGIATLGQQFLVLDAIVSSLQVLGISPHSLSWWGSFVGCFDTSYRFAEPSSRSQERSRVVGDFANRLLDAISTFKRGGRPKSQDIIFLKRFLFFSPHAPARYANPSWDQWRYDHLQFEERHPAACKLLRAEWPSY